MVLEAGQTLLAHEPTLRGTSPRTIYQEAPEAPTQPKAYHAFVRKFKGTQDHLCAKLMWKRRNRFWRMKNHVTSNHQIIIDATYSAITVSRSHLDNRISPTVYATRPKVTAGKKQRQQQKRTMLIVGHKTHNAL